MESIIEQCYNYNLVDSNPQSIKYDFVSIGEKDIPKRVTLKPLPDGLEHYYNMGLSNVYIDADGKEFTDDMSRDNNKGDDQKVMMTTFLCSLDFLARTEKENAKVLFIGNTPIKQRYYRMKISANFERLSEAFIIKGGYVPGLTTYIDSSTQQKRFNDFDIHKDPVQEDYNIDDAHKYQFFTFEAKEDDEYKNIS